MATAEKKKNTYIYPSGMKIFSFSLISRFFHCEYTKSRQLIYLEEEINRDHQIRITTTIYSRKQITQTRKKKRKQKLQILRFLIILMFTLLVGNDASA